MVDSVKVRDIGRLVISESGGQLTYSCGLVYAIGGCYPVEENEFGRVAYNHGSGWGDAL